MPDKEMTRSHYLMTKITNRFDKHGKVAINEFHGTAYQYLQNEEDIGNQQILEEEDDLERSIENSLRGAESEIPDVSVGSPSPRKQEEPITTDNWT